MWATKVGGCGDLHWRTEQNFKGSERAQWKIELQSDGSKVFIESTNYGCWEEDKGSSKGC